LLFIKSNKQIMILKRKANVTWNGAGRSGEGTISLESGVLVNTPYSFASRFENGQGVNPEELIGAAHAGCYSMALSFLLVRDGISSEKIETSATVTIAAAGAGFDITAVHLDVSAMVPGLDAATFQSYAEKAKDACAVSRLLKATITLSSRLLG
jgi:osmotically inducible protein OsmC